MERIALTELEELTLNNRSKSFLRETSKWAFFLSILGFIGIGLMIILGVFAGAIFNNMPNAENLPFDMATAMSTFYLVMALIYFFPVYYLLMFSRKMKSALLTKNNDTLSDAFELLKSHYKFMGVFTIIILSLYLLGIIVSLLGIALA